MKKIRSEFTAKLLTIELQSTPLRSFLLSQYYFVPNFVFIIVSLPEFLKKKERIRRALNIKENNNYIMHINLYLFINL